jgi:predicted small lipoprotein YifL
MGLVRSRLKRCLPMGALAVLALLAACGGGGELGLPAPDPQEAYRQLTTSANSKLDEARTLASDTPCTQTAQCSVLNFDAGRTPCENPASIDYSLASPTAAAASAAATAYSSLMQQANALGVAPATTGSCFVEAPFLPLVCQENRCVRAFSF